MNVTLPNGYTIQGIPEGTSKEEVMQKAIAAGYANAKDFDQPEQPTEQPPQDQGFIDNVGDRLSERGSKFGGDMEQIVNDMTSLNPLVNISANLRAISRVGGAVTGAAGDIIGEGVSSLVDTLTPEPVQDLVKEGVQYVADSPLGTAAKSVADIYAGFKQGNPRLAQDIEDQANIGSTILGVKAAAPVAKNIGKLTTKALDKSPVKVLNEAIPDIKTLKSKAGEIYARVDDSSSRVGGSKLDNLGASTRQTLTKAGFDKDLYPQINTVLKKLEEAKGGKLSLGEIQTLRKFTDAPLNSLNKSEVRLAGIARDKIDDFIDTLDAKDFIGTPPKNISADLKDARQLWRRAKKLETIDEAMNKAKLQASGFENGIRTQFRSILNNPNKRKGFTKDELEAMKGVVKGGTLENTAKALGKFGFNEGQASSMLLSSLGVAGGAAVGGAGGAVLIPAVGQVSKNLAQKLTRKGANGVSKIIAAGKEGDDIVKAYMQIVPKAERNVKDLTELLLRPDVSLKKLQSKIGSPNKPKNTMIENALYLTIMANKQGQQE